MIALEEHETHNKNFRSGMVQSWNKFCFQGGYIEFSVKLPGPASPAAVATGLPFGSWVILVVQATSARPRKLAILVQLVRYRILPNQTYVNGTGPYLATHSSGTYAYNGELSYLPACDTLPALVQARTTRDPTTTSVVQRPKSISLKFRCSTRTVPSTRTPRNRFRWHPSTMLTLGATPRRRHHLRRHDHRVQHVHRWPDPGSRLLVTSRARHRFPADPNQYVKYGVEFSPDFNYDGSGSMTWYVDGKPSWTVNPKAFPPRANSTSVSVSFPSSLWLSS